MTVHRTKTDDADFDVTLDVMGTGEQRAFIRELSAPAWQEGKSDGGGRGAQKGAPQLGDNIAGGGDCELIRTQRQTEKNPMWWSAAE